MNSFTTFYKRDQGTGLREPSRFRRQALDDLEAFTTFMKKDHKNKRSPRSISREALRDSLGTFSSFMDPYQYYKRVRVLDSEPVQTASALSGKLNLRKILAFA